MCGDQLSWDNAELGDRIRDLALTDCIFLLGRRKDVNDIMAASSVVVSSSRSEGFPNVIAEAMACGVTCVATDVGDSRLIIGSAGIVVPPRQPQALAEAVLTVLFQPPASADSIPAGRARIMENFELSSMIEKYERLYERVLSSDPQSNARWNGEHMTDSQTN